MTPESKSSSRLPRRWVRHKLKLPVRLILPQSDKTLIVEGHGCSLSEGEMCVFAGVELAVGDVTQIEFTSYQSGVPLRVRCVVRNRKGYFYGVEFIQDSKEDRCQALTLRDMLRNVVAPTAAR